jgi:hypothetical protein
MEALLILGLYAGALVVLVKATSAVRRSVEALERIAQATERIERTLRLNASSRAP